MTQERKIILLPLLFFFLQSFSQRDNVWLFGTNAALNFSVVPPLPFSGGQTSIPDNTSTMSDVSGKLLFYTDGVTVWNKNHQAMPNGSGLLGNYTAGQCALIVPIPCSEDEYLIFHTTEFASPGYLRYTKVNMTLNGGLGDVVTQQKNVLLGTGFTEKLCAIYNPNGKNYWVLTHKWNSADFVAYSVTASGLSSQVVTSSVGSVHNCGVYSGAHDAMGQLTISRNGAKVLNALTCTDRFELFDFNLATGVVSNPVVIPSTGSAWGTAFSPDNSKIYVNSIFGDYVKQYVITNPSSILSSSTTLVSTGQPGYNFGYMELGPDNKLYIPRPGTSFVSVVNQPNQLGAASGFSLNGLSLGSLVASHGISRIAYNITSVAVTNLSVSVTPSIICAGGTYSLTASGALNYNWSTGGSSSSITLSPTTSTVVFLTGIDACEEPTTKSISLQVGICTSIEDLKRVSSASVYPTLFQNFFTIGAIPEHGVVTIFNADGRVVYRSDLIKENGPLHVNLGSHEAGIYYLQIQGNNEVTFHKLIKTCSN